MVLLLWKCFCICYLPLSLYQPYVMANTLFSFYKYAKNSITEIIRRLFQLQMIEKLSILSERENVEVYHLQSQRADLPSGKVWSRSRWWSGLAPSLYSYLYWLCSQMPTSTETAARQVVFRMHVATFFKCQGQWERMQTPLSDAPTKVSAHLMRSFAHPSQWSGITWVPGLNPKSGTLASLTEVHG